MISVSSFVAVFILSFFFVASFLFFFSLFLSCERAHERSFPRRALEEESMAVFFFGELLKNFLGMVRFVISFCIVLIDMKRFQLIDGFLSNGVVK